MAQRPWFKDWFNSPYYHLLYAGRNEQEAADFIDALLANLRPAPDARMLDVACGRGRHARYLQSLGYDVTGIDLSPNSIFYAKAYENDRLHFYQHDMRMPFWIRYFDYAFNFFTSFGYFDTRREHDNAMRSMAQSLRGPGVLVIDYLNVRFWENNLQHKMEREEEGVAFHITKWMDENHFFKKIEVEDEKLDRPLEFCERIAKFTLGDFTEMLAFQGMQVKEVFGDYQLGSYKMNESPRLIMVAQKQ
ncbi:MAG TPA: class I SAM-dependent methyltransferase [Dinghuibacter sp.]|jgi:SAM-dependent methyltransferase|uniref:class I SAM-dependent methyltransferase n=1 Tax=Dinghuibacter sp. TaxID=2024697 RepID=UPI002CAFF05F|nr:class I SAM-dependent methyltransferase [Dinghuibacter sp.]HTJ13772.1 class I SAM-dependent methyltransferase [Dinghuibacter sp.]